VAVYQRVWENTLWEIGVEQRQFLSKSQSGKVNVECQIEKGMWQRAAYSGESTPEKILCGVRKTPEDRSSKVNCYRRSEEDMRHQIVDFGKK
jgi:hypothetical protein